MFKVQNVCSSVTPEGIYPILKNDEFFKSRCGKITESALVFCTVLSLRYYYFKDKSNEEVGNPFQKIGSNFLVKILGRENYKSILKRLAELHIIECDRSYMVGVTTKGYRLNDMFVGQRYIARTLRYDSIIKRVEELNEYFKLKGLKNYPYLFQQYESMKKIHIDAVGAIEWIEENKDKVENGERVINDVDYYYQSVQKIENGYCCRIAVSETNSRVHSSFTSIPRKLRPFLCVVNEETGELRREKCTIDCKNSQPLIISVIIEKEGIAPDADYKKFCLEGTIYEVIAAELGEQKQWVKDRFMDSLLFTPENSEYAQKIKIATGINLQKRKFTLYFKKRFPAVYKWLLEKKRSLKTTSSAVTKNTHNVGGSALAYSVQRFEAQLWIHSLLKEVPSDLIYVSIHDSIMIFSPTAEQVDSVLGKLNELGKELYGLDKLPLKIEYEY